MAWSSTKSLAEGWKASSQEATRRHDYEEIVQEALNEPGKVSAAYSAFWNYSLGNQFLALMQLGTPEPINTFPGWKALGRHVKKGEKAIELIMPIFVKAKYSVSQLR